MLVYTRSMGLIQPDQDAICEWSERNFMPPSISTCMAVDYSLCSLHHNYSLNGQPLSSATQCSDLGVLRNSSFFYDAHVQNTALKASTLVEIIMTVFGSLDPEFLVKVYVTYIRPELEYASTIWPLPSVAYCTVLKNVQCRFTRHLRGMAEFVYEQHLSVLNLLRLHDQRVYNDMLIVYKVLPHRSKISLLAILASRYAMYQQEAMGTLYSTPSQLLQQ